MTREQLLARFPRASETFLKANADDSPLHTSIEKRPEKPPLVGVLPGAPPGVPGPAKRHLLRCRIFSCRPLDASNYELKYLEDGLVEAGLLPGDAWDQVEIHVRSEKVHRKADERTEITIEPIPEP